MLPREQNPPAQIIEQQQVERRRIYRLDGTATNRYDLPDEAGPPQYWVGRSQAQRIYRVMFGRNFLIMAFHALFLWAALETVDRPWWPAPVVLAGTLGAFGIEWIETNRAYRRRYNDGHDDGYLDFAPETTWPQIALSWVVLLASLGAWGLVFRWW